MEFIYGAPCWLNVDIQLPLNITKDYRKDIDYIDFEDKDGRALTVSIGDNIIVGVELPQYNVYRGTVSKIHLYGDELKWISLYINDIEIDARWVGFIIKL